MQAGHGDVVADELAISHASEQRFAPVLRVGAGEGGGEGSELAQALADDLLRDGETLQSVWRYVIVQLLDDYSHDLARRDDWPLASWARKPGRYSSKWWFVTPLRGMHPTALQESPPSFRTRGVFITAGALSRV